MALASSQLSRLKLDCNDDLQMSNADLRDPLKADGTAVSLSMRKRNPAAEPGFNIAFFGSVAERNTWSATSVRNIVKLLAAVPLLQVNV